jgi:hypothetical protein
MEMLIPMKILDKEIQEWLLAVDLHNNLSMISVKDGLNSFCFLKMPHKYTQCLRASIYNYVFCKSWCNVSTLVKIYALFFISAKKISEFAIGYKRWEILIVNKFSPINKTWTSFISTHILEQCLHELLSEKVIIMPKLLNVHTKSPLRSAINISTTC